MWDGLYWEKYNLFFHVVFKVRLWKRHGLWGGSQIISDYGFPLVGMEIRGRRTGPEGTLGKMWRCAFGEPLCWKLHCQYKWLRKFSFDWKCRTGIWTGAQSYPRGYQCKVEYQHFDFINTMTEGLALRCVLDMWFQIFAVCASLQSSQTDDTFYLIFCKSILRNSQSP